ncbi:MAG: hypothetical protein ACR2G6_01710 [Gemmatimonadaceae bacterium]
MTRRSKLWRVGAWLFTIINVAGAGIAAVGGEAVHTAVHVGLLLLGAYLVWRLAPRAVWQDLPSVQPAQDRLDQLQQSVDAVALEVERIGEAQRFSAEIQAERAGARQ